MKYLLLLFMLLKLSTGKAQVQNSELLIKAELVGRGKYSGGQRNPEGYFVRLAVSNVSTLNKIFWIYRCSWPDLWFVNRPNTFLYYPGCDSNYPVDVKLSPGQEVVFYGFVVEAIQDKNGEASYIVPNSTTQNTDATEEIKFAFAEVENEKYLEFSNTRELIQQGKAKVHWSNSVFLKFYNSSYRVIKPTN